MRCTENRNSRFLSASQGFFLFSFSFYSYCLWSFPSICSKNGRNRGFDASCRSYRPDTISFFIIIIIINSVSSCCCSVFDHFDVDSLNRLTELLQRLLNIHRSDGLIALFGCYMAGATWNCCHLSVFCVPHTVMHHATSLHAKPHTMGACVCSFNLPLAPLAEWPGSCTCCFCWITRIEWIPT